MYMYKYYAYGKTSDICQSRKLFLLCKLIELILKHSHYRIHTHAHVHVYMYMYICTSDYSLESPDPILSSISVDNIKQ